MLQMYFADRFTSDMQWVIWDFSILAIGVLLAIELFKKTPYKELKRKSIIMIIILLNTWALADFTLLSIIEPNQDITFIRNVTALLSFAIFPAWIFYIIYRQYDRISADYNVTNSYLAYKRPKSLQGLIASLFTFPYGQCCLIINGSRFSYKEGAIKQEPHVDRCDPNKQRYIYKKVSDLKAATAKKELVGKRWTPMNNCFSVFNRFVKKNG